MSAQKEKTFIKPCFIRMQKSQNKYQKRSTKNKNKKTTKQLNGIIKYPFDLNEHDTYAAY